MRTISYACTPSGGQDVSYFMESECSLASLQKPVTGPHSEAVGSSP